MKARQELYIVAMICLLLGFFPNGILGNSQSMQKSVYDNLRQLVYAAKQYSIDNDVEVVTYNDLVGPGKYVSTVDEVDGESYSEFVYGPTDTEYTVRTLGGLVITYHYAGGYSWYDSKTGKTGFSDPNPVIFRLWGESIRKRTVSNVSINILTITVAVFVVILLIWIIRKKHNDERSG